VFSNDERKESFGEYLRRNREASGKTLEGISRTTRISKRYLEAFEDNNSKNLPEEAFARGFLKAYAKEVGLDIEDCLARYDRFHRSEKPTQIKDVRPTTKFGVEGFEPLQNQAWLVKLLSILVVAAGVVVAIVFLIQNHSSTSSEQQKSEVSEPSDQEENVAEAPPDPSVEVAQKPAPTIAAKESEKPSESVAALPSPVKPSILTVKAIHDGKLSIKADDSAIQEIALKAGDTQTINVFKDVEIRTADRAAFNLLYNGKPLEISGPMIKLFNRYLFSRKP
jgi:cytoskeletal protein RodZ